MLTSRFHALEVVALLASAGLRRGSAARRARDQQSPPNPDAAA